MALRQHSIYMATEHRYGHTFYAGLASPGPAADYTLNSCFDGAAIKQGQKGANKKYNPPELDYSSRGGRELLCCAARADPRQ